MEKARANMEKSININKLECKCFDSNIFRVKKESININKLECKFFYFKYEVIIWLSVLI